MVKGKRGDKKIVACMGWCSGGKKSSQQEPPNKLLTLPFFERGSFILGRLRSTSYSPEFLFCVVSRAEPGFKFFVFFLDFEIVQD